MNQIGRELGVGYLGRLGAQGKGPIKRSGSSASENSPCEIEIMPRAAYERDDRLPPRSGRDRSESYFEAVLNLYCGRFGLNSKNSGRSLVA